jgi:FlaA1/EpsC-like NDP-sugar epimerase
VFDNKVLMITGGTGSFGNTVLNRFLDTDVREIRIFSRDEKKQEDMRISLSNDKVKFYIGALSKPWWVSITSSMRRRLNKYHLVSFIPWKLCEQM